MQRILHIVGKMDRAGAETMIMNIYRKMDRTRIQFDFIVFSDKTGDFDEEIKLLGGRIFNLTPSNLFNKMIRLREFLIKHPEYLIVHSHILFGSAYMLLAARSAHVPFRIAHSHSTQNKSKGVLVDLLYKKISRLLLNSASNYKIACGVEAAKFLYESNENVLILPNAVDIRYCADVGTGCAHHLKNYKEDVELLILQVGRLEAVKNHSFSLQLAQFMKKEGYSFRMLFAGQGILENAIKKQITLLELDDVCELLGIRTDIPEVMAGADVMLMPSRHEGFPVVLVESQAIGLPAVISSNIAEEVDLGVGLITFLSLEESLENWTKHLYLAKGNKKISKNNRIQILKTAGFDVQNNADRLKTLYLSMR